MIKIKGNVRGSSLRLHRIRRCYRAPTDRKSGIRTDPRIPSRTTRIANNYSIRRHRFPTDVQRGLAALRKLDNWHGPLALITDWSVIVIAVLVTELFSGWVWWIAYFLIALPLICTRQRALATLLHESAHGVLTKSRFLNLFLGTYPSAYLVLQTYRAYSRSHLRDHHGAFGNPYVDPDLRAHIASGLYRPRSGRAFVLKYLLAPLVGLRTPALINDLVVNRLSGLRREVISGIGVALYVSTIGALFFASGIGEVFVIYWVVPLFLVFPLVNWYIELLEHFPLIGNEQVDILTTRPRAVGLISRHFFGIHNEGYHLDHHLSPKIPYWNLPAAHRLRLRDPSYRAAIAVTAPAGKGLFWQFRDMVRRVESGQISSRLGEFAYSLPEQISSGGATAAAAVEQSRELAQG